MVCYLDVNIPQEHFTFRFCGFAVTSDSQLLHPSHQEIVTFLCPTNLFVCKANQLICFIPSLDGMFSCLPVGAKQTVQALEMWNGYILV